MWWPPGLAWPGLDWGRFGGAGEVAWFVAGAGNRYAVCGSHTDGYGSGAGAIAQLVERLHGMQEVRSSNLLSSTQVRDVFGIAEQAL
jgi:hypothetical protein